MRTIGVRELKAHLGDVLREVREHEEVFVVTQRGRRIARLVPENQAPVSSLDEASWLEMDRLAEEIGRDWPSDTTGADAVAKDRREI